MGSSKFEDLHERAERKLDVVIGELKDMSDMDVARLVNELQIHQVELKMQNDELVKGHLKLIKSEEKFRDLFDFAPVGYLILDKKGKIQDANLTVASQLGSDRRDLVKSDLYKFIGDSEKDRFYLYLEEIFNTRVKKTCEISLTRKDGSSFHSQLESVVTEEGGKTEYCRSSVTDISRIKDAEDILKENETLLKASLEEKETLLKEIHHRVKNNMMVVNSLLELQARSSDDVNLQKMLNITISRVKAIGLIHEHLYRSNDISKINIHDYIENIIDDIKRIHFDSTHTIEIINRSGNIELDMDHAIPCGLIINELVTNSLKHAFPGGDNTNCEIIIEASSVNNMIEFSVSDNGTGISEEIDFQEIKSLGLRLIPMLVKQVHGEWSLDRTGGTRFIVSFSPH
jgi:PAS domain S-box-containing protein